MTETEGANDMDASYYKRKYLNYGQFAIKETSLYIIERLLWSEGNQRSLACFMNLPLIDCSIKSLDRYVLGKRFKGP